MRICCCLAGHLELARRRDLYGTPVVVGDADGHVLAVSEEALPFSVEPGIPIRQAEHLCPHATLLSSDQVAADRLRERIAAALYDLAPCVEVRVEGIAWLDLEGVPSPSESIREARLLNIDDARTFLAPLPTRELWLDGEQMERLDLLGLRTLGAVAAIGPRELESQLGREGRRAVLLARGLEPDQLTPWQPPMFTSAHRQFEPPVQDREALLFVARALCGDLAEELGLRGAGAKQMRVRLICEDGDVEARESIVRHPLSSTAELFGLAGSWIKSWQPHAPINEMWIELPVLEAAGRRQLRLWTGGDGNSDEVTAALERLQERHGDAVVRKPRPVLPSSPIPSQRFA